MDLVQFSLGSDKIIGSIWLGCMPDNSVARISINAQTDVFTSEIIISKMSKYFDVIAVSNVLPRKIQVSAVATYEATEATASVKMCSLQKI